MRINSEADFDALARAAKLLAVASAWTELGLWDALAAADGPVDLAEVSGDTRALTITAPLLAHAGLLDGGGRHWRLSAVARAMHGRGELPTERNLGWIGDLTRTPQVLRDGGPVRGPDGESKATSGGVRPNDRAATRTFLDMLYRRSEAAAEQLADWIGPRLASGAGAEARKVMGMTVFSGMLVATVIGREESPRCSPSMPPGQPQRRRTVFSGPST